MNKGRNDDEGTAFHHLRLPMTYSKPTASCMLRPISNDKSRWRRSRLTFFLSYFLMKIQTSNFSVSFLHNQSFFHRVQQRCDGSNAMKTSNIIPIRKKTNNGAHKHNVSIDQTIIFELIYQRKAEPYEQFLSFSRRRELLPLFKSSP